MSEKPEPKPFEGVHSPDDLDLFGPFRRLLPILIEGETAFVPEDNSVLRCLQYLELKEGWIKMEWGRYCWNDTKGCCELYYRSQPDEAPRVGRACRVRAEAGLEILQLPRGGRRCPR